MRPLLLSLFLLTTLVAPVGSADIGPVQIDLDSLPARQISAYNLFKDPARQIPNEGVLPYDVNTPLFSDYASKHRFVWMPEGTAATYRADENLRVPRRCGVDQDLRLFEGYP